MPLYEYAHNAENRIRVSEQTAASVVSGSGAVAGFILDQIREKYESSKSTVLVAMEGWYGIDWTVLLKELSSLGKSRKIAVEPVPASGLFQSRESIGQYKQPYLTEDPSFGIVCEDGVIEDLLDEEKCAALREKLMIRRDQRSEDCSAILVFGYGSGSRKLDDLYDLYFYFDFTRQPLLWKMWDGKLVPFGFESSNPDYNWKEYYYIDHYLLLRQKDYALQRMDYYVECVDAKHPKCMPRESYDEIIQTLVRYPVKEVKIFQPGNWGAYRYKDLWDVPGLGCNAWNETAGPELSILVDIGNDEMIQMPVMNLMQYPEEFVGSYIHETYPGVLPFDVWLNDGYFDTPQPSERTSMPIHLHPSTDYVRRNFKEPLGRYETYYVAEAYQDANTWLGYREDADMEEWERLCRESGNQIPIENWRDYVTRWDSSEGDLYLIPPGTVHGHGGNQLILEMDTCTSNAGTEYSFFLYDFARKSWEDSTQDMTGRPLKMHTEHGFRMDKCRREKWVKDHLLAKPRIQDWNKEYSMDQYDTVPEMPFHIERIHFEKHGENSTGGKYMQILTLTVGDKVVIRSKENPQYQSQIEKWQSVIVPACFGDYELVNEGAGGCTVVQLRWKKG